MVSKKTRAKRRNEEGQALIEYILLISTILAAYLILVKALDRYGFADKLYGPLKTEYRHLYQYGHPLAKGPDDGGPEYHARYSGGKNFRLFMNSTPR